MGAGALIAARYITQDMARVTGLRERSMNEALDTQRLIVAGERAARFTLIYLVKPEAESLEQLGRARADFALTLGRLKAANGGPSFQELFEAIESAQLRLRKMSEALIQARSHGAPFEDVQARLELELVPARREMDDAIASLERMIRLRFEQEATERERLLQQNIRLFTSSLLLALFALLGMLALLASVLRQQQQRERELQLSETKFAGMVSIAADAIISIDARRRITIFNKGAESIFGFQAAEVLGQPLDILLPENVRSLHSRHVAAFAAGATTARHMGERQEIHGRRKNGEEFPAEAAISKLEVEGQAIMTVVLRDISERRRSEREQRFLSAATAALAESLDVQVTLDRVARLIVPERVDSCTIHLVREQSLILAAVAHADAASAQALREALDLNPIPLDSRHAIAQVVRSGEARLTECPSEAQRQELAHSWAPYQALLHPTCNSLLCVPLRVRERCIGAISMMVEAPRHPMGARDLALAEELARRAALAIDNAHLYAEAQRATRSRDEMLGIVAHDLRSPVNAIALTTSIMLRRVKKQGAGADQLQGIESITQSTQRMNRLIEDLLDVVRMDAGKLSIQRSRRPAAQLVADAVMVHQPLCAEARIELKEELSADLPELSVDADRILQVFSNLLGNALKFTPPEGRVTVGAALEEGAVVFRVTDSGPGIPAEHLPHLFDRFWQARSSDRRGAGLGLAITKGIVEAHGGRIWARSQPGEGSTFYFSIPLPPAGSEGRSESPALR